MSDIDQGLDQLHIVLQEQIAEFRVKLAFRDRRTADLERQLESARSVAVDRDQKLAVIGEKAVAVSRLIRSGHTSSAELNVQDIAAIANGWEEDA